MKKVNAFILVCGLVSSLASYAQTSESELLLQKKKVQQMLSYYREFANQGDAEAKQRIEKTQDFLESLESRGKKALTRNGDIHTYVDENCNVNYSYNPEDGTAMVIESENPKDDVVILETFTVDGKKYTVTSIGYSAFCFSHITSLRLPKSITSIDYDAFGWNREVAMIEVDKGNPIYDSRNMCNAIIETETNTLLWGCKETIIPEDVVSIGMNAFHGFDSPENPIFPSSIKSINIDAFGQCDNLKELHIPSTVTSIAGNPFWATENLTHIEVDDNNPIYDSRNNCNAIIFRGTNTLRVGCMNSIIQDDVQGIAWEAFWCCTYLKTIHIPASVIHIESDITNPFYGCYNLESITVDKANTMYNSHLDCNALIETKTNKLITGCINTIIPEGIEIIGEFAFFQVRFTEIVLPESIKTIGESAFDNSSLEHITIPENVTTIDRRAFGSCYELATITSLIKQPFPIDENVFKNGTDRGTLYVPYGTAELYSSTDGWKEIKNIMEMVSDTSCSLTIVDDSGNDITGNCSILWYNANDKMIGKGRALKGVPNGTEVYFSITLGEDLGRIFHEVERQSVITEEDIITFQLKRIEMVMLTGRVSAVDIDKNTAIINVRQILNGKYEETFTTQTDEKGEFSVEVYDTPSDIVISREDCLTSTLHRDGFNGNGSMGTMLLNLSGYTLSPDITLQKAINEGNAVELTAWSDGLSNIEFTLTNMTRNSEITDFTIQNGNLIVKEVLIGDEIALTAKSKQGIFAEATVRFTITGRTSFFDLPLIELGGVDAICPVSNNANTVGYLYDNSGVLVASGSYTGESLCLRHLPEGNYTLVSMGSSQRFGKLTHLSDLISLGQDMSINYVASLVEVTNGNLTSVSVPNVPRLDEAKFNYFTGRSYFSSDRSSLTVGNYLTLSAHVDFVADIADKVDNVVLTVDLPEGCLFIDNSVISNRKAVPYTMDDNRLTIPLNKEQWQNQVRFSIIPTVSSSYNITAMASVDLNGLVYLPIGTAKFDAMGLSLNLPKKTIDTNITINGTSIGHSIVSIYDNDVLIGNTSSDYNGAWTACCKLYKPYSHSFHDIYAKITTDYGIELTSETQQVEYEESNNILPKKVTMVYYNPEFDMDYHIVFDLIGGTTIPSYYYYFPYKDWPNWWETYETEPKDFTFLADFNINDCTKIKNVNIKVLNSDGTIRTLPAIFDKKQNCWVATTKYANSNRLPRNATIEYDMEPLVTEENHEEGILDQTAIMVNITNQINHFVQNNASATLMEEKESSLSFLHSLTGDATYISSVEEIDFAEAEQMMKQYQFDYYEGEDGCIGTYTVWDDYHIELLCVDIDQRYAMRIILSSPKSSTRALKDLQLVKEISRPFRNGGFLDLLGQFGGVAVDLAGVTDYLSVKSDFDNMLQLIVRYTDNYNKVRSSLLSDMLAKCPDGSYRYPHSYMNLTYTDISAISEYESSFANKYYQYLEEYKHKLAASVITDISTAFVGLALSKVASLTKVWASKANQAFKKLMSKRTHLETSASVLSSSLDLGLEYAVNGVDKITDYKNFQNIRDNTLSWAANENLSILKRYSEIRQRIKDNSKKCEKDKNDEEEKRDEPGDERTENKPHFPASGTVEMLDPSGYVYEAVLSNRMPGVTTTVYEQKNGNAVKWNAEDYSQQNPLLTDDKGFYRWDVPQGMWQVKYEKEGYETAYSDWLPVPPPQLDVNIGMKQSTPPEVNQMHGYESGITIDMSKYMLPATLSTDNITVTSNGVAVKGSIEMLNSEKEPSGESEFASKMKFIPETHFSSTDNVVVTVHKEVESYCGVKMEKDHVQTVKIEAEIKEIVAEDLITVPYQGSKDIQIAVLPKSAAAGRTLRVQTSSSMIASLNADETIVDDNGIATLTVNGELPGGAYLTFTIDDTDVTKESKIKVVTEYDMVATPTASIKSGETVNPGTLLTLNCETEGATIYYTLDGSCPCDEAKRIKYESPFVIYPDMIVKTMAVKDNVDDSDVATFVYNVAPIEVGIPVATGTQWATYYQTDYDYQLTDNVKAYVVSDVDEISGTVTLYPVPGIPKGVPVLLHTASEGGFTAEDMMTILLNSINVDVKPSENYKGVTEPTDISGEGTVYVLAGSKFVKGDISEGANTVIPANRCYISIPQANGARSLNFVFDGETTEIMPTRITSNKSEEGWYNLNGQRIYQPTKKGLYVRNGRKVVVK